MEFNEIQMMLHDVKIVQCSHEQNAYISWRETDCYHQESGGANKQTSQGRKVTTGIALSGAQQTNKLKHKQTIER
jgi:hypothetical protein